MMTKNSFLNLAHKLQVEVIRQVVILPSINKEITFFAFVGGMNVSEYTNILKDIFTDEGFDIVCDHSDSELEKTDAIALFEEKAESWEDGKVPVCAFFVDQGWETLVFSEENGSIPLCYRNITSLNRNNTFSCLVEGVGNWEELRALDEDIDDEDEEAADEAGEMFYEFIANMDEKINTEIILKVIHNPHFAVKYN